MKPFDIFITYMSWDGGGKNRPVLAFILGDGSVDVYQITTKYEGKRGSIQAQYFKIEDWEQAGLLMKSYIDTGTLITLSMSTFKDKTPIGNLTENDKRRFLEFLSD
ncbi:MAG: hypothetical protein FWG70_11555 [Oscillospiraceae bacterium]|nr:hypothetical protein [Oscillospiraceae bacterium]